MKYKADEWLSEFAAAIKDVQNVGDAAPHDMAVLSLGFREALEGAQVHIGHGIAGLAEAAGETLISDKKHIDRYPFEAWFIHDGIKYFQIGKTYEEATK